MIQEAPGSPSSEAISVLLLPHRSLSRPGLVLYFVAQSIATLGFALLAAWRGIVLAPLFAVLALAVLGYCLRRVWRASGQGEIITLAPEQIEVRRTPANEAVAQFHPYWVKLRLEPGRWSGWPSRLLVCSHGREVEIGRFLNDDERRGLAQRLTDLLRSVQARGGPSELRSG
jgi:uncharacterized membrane protein